jgi:hypothetical protein
MYSVDVPADASRALTKIFVFSQLLLDISHERSFLKTHNAFSFYRPYVTNHPYMLHEQ